MRGRRLLRVGGTLAGILMIAALVCEPAAASASPMPGGPVAHPAPTIVTPESVRLDRQSPENSMVVISGLDAASVARVSWGDGTRTDRYRGSCTTRRALRSPTACSISLGHTYTAPGTFTITAAVPGTRVSRLVTITSPPTRWRPPHGWVQPTGWTVINGGATYYPCQQILWSFDRTSQPADGGQIYADVESGLAMLSGQTGLTFTETADPAQADLTFAWGDTGGFAGLGGGSNGRGEVVIDSSDWWPRDKWPGFGIVTQPDGSYAVGHGWLIVHEVMHVLGLGHVEDPTSVMNHVATVTTFNSGDLDGLRTLYLNNACPSG